VGGGNPDVDPHTLRPGGLGITNLYRWATAFGIGSELGIELPGELAGRMPDSQWKRRNYGESWSTGDTYNAAFGQGYVTVTPLQLINAAAAIANGGTLYQPTIIKNLQDANGNIVQEFQPHIARTVAPQPGQEIVLTLQEDMILHGGDSLVCHCENRPDNPYYDAQACNPDSYLALYDLDPNPDDDITNIVEYRVNVPYDYAFNGNVCNQLVWESLQRETLNDPMIRHGYIPPLAKPETIQLIQQGMRLVVVEGTSSEQYVKDAPPLLYVNEAGKTGTAEYCDDIAFPQGLCVPGQWPSHAWYIGYAPYEAPEIIVLAFVYHGGEGSQVATPIVREVLDAYFKLKAQRGQETVQ
jgi:penicillin-binding protein 2